MRALRWIGAVLGGLAVMITLVTVLAALVSSNEPADVARGHDDVSGVFEAWFRRRHAPRSE